MRFLVITTQWHFVNPTRELFLRGLRQHANFEVVGPGYGAVYHRIADYFRWFGKFDGLIVDSSVYLTYGTEKIRKYWPGADSETFVDMFDHTPKIVILNLLDDFHGSTPDQFIRLLDPKAIVLSNAIGTQNFSRARFRLAKEREHWFKTDIEKIPASMGRQYILFPAALDESEFAARGGPRTDEVAVPGVQYFIRRKAAELLKKEGISVTTGDDWSFRLLRAIVGRTGYLTHVYRQEFWNLLDRVKVAVTCSATVGYPVRKFFEVPARRTALVAEFFDDPEALGFRSRVNCVALQADGSDVVELVRWLLTDETARRCIAEAGQELIWAHHRIRHRVEQLLNIMEAVAQNNFATAYWAGGRLKVVRRSDQKALVGISSS